LSRSGNQGIQPKIFFSNFLFMTDSLKTHSPEMKEAATRSGLGTANFNLKCPILLSINTGYLAGRAHEEMPPTGCDGHQRTHTHPANRAE
jgi:hypothetical protein